MNIVILGLSITSSWGNGHATTYRGLVRELSARGHHVTFLERDVSWYATHRDIKSLPPARIELYGSLDKLKGQFANVVAEADAVIIGSYVPDGIRVCEWALSTSKGPVLFYDIDTPITLERMRRGESEYLEPGLIPRFAMYLSFTGGPILERLEKEYGSPMARPLYCSFDPGMYYPEDVERRWDLAFLGTYSADRQAVLQKLLIEPAAQWPSGRFAVAGPQYPPNSYWPTNVERIDHLAPDRHRRFYSEQIFTLNITRAPMASAGYSPSVRLFEAAACGVPVITDEWEGLEDFFEPGEELMVARDAQDTLHFIREMSTSEAREIGAAARRKALSRHTAAHRAEELEGYLFELTGKSRRPDGESVNHTAANP